MKRNQIFILTLALFGAAFVFDGFAQQADSLAWKHRGANGQGNGAQTGVQNQSTDEAIQNNGMKRSGFSDADGDGLNDRDADGDGIPNGQDADYVRGSAQNNGTGDCTGDGTGSGTRQRGGGKGQGGGKNR